MLDQILQNTADKIEVDIYYNNVLTAPSSINIREIRDPNGTVILTEQAVIAGATTGRYYYTMAAIYTATLGVYTAIWRFVIGTATYEHTQNFEVVSALRQGYVVPQEVRDIATYSEITSTIPTDAVLQKYINKTTQIMDAYFGSSINYAQYSEKIRCVLDKVHNGVHIQLKHRPIVSLTSVVLTANPANTVSLDVDNIRINNEAGYLEYMYDVSWPSLKVCIFDLTKTSIIPVATVVYTAGFVTVPDQVKYAAVMLVESLYKMTKGDGQKLKSFKIANQTETYENSLATEKAMSEFGLEDTASALRLLRGYRQPMRHAGIFGPLG